MRAIRSSAFAALVGVVALLVPLVSAAQTAPEKNTCLFYEDINYKGKHFGLFKGDALLTKAGLKTDAIYPNGFKGRVFTAPEWDGKVSSTKVPKGCKLSIQMQSGKVAAGVDKDIPKYAEKFDDKGVAFGCTC